MTVITNDTYEIALVLDNSGSMSSSAGGKSKMDAAKEAAKKLVNIMLTSPNSKGRTEISLVPFTLSVKVGASYKNECVARHRPACLRSTGRISTAANAVWKPNSRFDLFTRARLRLGRLRGIAPGRLRPQRRRAAGRHARQPLRSRNSRPTSPAPRARAATATSSRLPASRRPTPMPTAISTTPSAPARRPKRRRTRRPSTSGRARSRTACASTKASRRSTPPRRRGPNYNCDAMALTRMTTIGERPQHLHRRHGRGRQHRPARGLHLGLAHDHRRTLPSATASPTASQTTTRSSSS